MTDAEDSDAFEQRRAVADRLRVLAGRLATDELAPERLAALSAALEAAEAAFDPVAPERTAFARSFAGTADAHPLGAGTSGVYPPFAFEEGDGVLVARIDFGPAWEGPPDLVHGGFLAAGFDMVLSAMAHRVLGHAVTRRLQVRYLRPTFWRSSLRYEVTADEPVGRLLDLRGVLFADDQVTMRASAQFASVDPARFADRRTPG